MSALIRWTEWIKFHKGYRWSHAALIETPGTIIEALFKGVDRTPLSKYRDIEYVLVRTDMDPLDAEQAVRFAQSCLPKHYGYVEFIGVALRFLTPGHGLWFGLSGAEICSGLVAQALVRGWANFPRNPAGMAPAELAQAYGIPDVLNHRRSIAK